MQSSITKGQAIALRKTGYSLTELTKEFKIAKSTASRWVRNVPIHGSGKLILGKKKKETHKHLFRYISNKQLKKHQWVNYLHEHYRQKLQDIDFNILTKKLLCSFLFWAEGNKCLNCLQFVNSNPIMIDTFLTLLRESFNLDESKFRVVMHLHEYHSKDISLKFWAEVTHISSTQFTKPYLKPNTGLRKKPGYQGWVSIKYYDFRIAHELSAIYNAYTYSKIIDT